VFIRTIGHRGKVLGATLVSFSEQIVLFIARNAHPCRIIPPKATIVSRKIWEVVILHGIRSAVPWFVFRFWIYGSLVIRTV